MTMTHPREHRGYNHMVTRSTLTSQLHRLDGLWGLGLLLARAPPVAELLGKLETLRNSNTSITDSYIYGGDDQQAKDAITTTAVL